MITTPKYGSCVKCGKNCRKNESRCFKCKKLSACYICGIETTKNICSSECQGKFDRFHHILSPSIEKPQENSGHVCSSESSDNSKDELVYQGDILNVWTEDSKHGKIVFFAFIEPSVSLVFTDREVLHLLMGDLQNLIVQNPGWTNI